MKTSVLTAVASLALFCTFGGKAQDESADRSSSPIYHVNVIERTVKAVDYQYRSGPTKVDFRGTVLMPKAKGDATVESKAGRTEIDARFDHLENPQRFGREYLTYVLWAITPQGRSVNLGEAVANGSDNARLHVTTQLQAFGLIVTAEPYSAVRQPSSVVVLENQIRPDTMGQIEPVQAKYELLPRGEYTYDVGAPPPAPDGTRAVSTAVYEELLEVYQAQNAVQIARAAGADHYAGDTYQKAEQLLEKARDLEARKADRSSVVTVARQSAQTAEDALVITRQRKQEEDLALAKSDASRERELRARAEADAHRAQMRASDDQKAPPSGQPQDQPPSVSMPSVPAQAAPPQPAAAELPRPPARPDSEKSELRLRLLQNLSNTSLETRDTPRGLTVTVPDADFRGGSLSQTASVGLERVASVISSQPGLYVQVEGNTDGTGNQSRDQQISYARAAAVRDTLVRYGVAPTAISTRGLGSARPMASNTSAAGRAENRRVEIIVAGEPIGILASWDRTYLVMPKR